eukprot:m.824655 g.824655  ORF g.824655 m.824655 type:complete len:197 (+) comp59407_c0_seq8:138-728(+)
MQELLEVYQASVEFKLPKLQRVCSAYIKSHINAGNLELALRALVVGLSGGLREHVISLLVKESAYRKIIMLPEFERLETPVIVELIRRREFSAASRLDCGSPTPGSTSARAGDDLRGDLLAFLQSEAGSVLADVQFECDDYKCAAHRAILCARSSFFQALFHSGHCHPGLFRPTIFLHPHHSPSSLQECERQPAGS